MKNSDMKKSQNRYSKTLADIVRDIIWAQWNRLGLNGTGGINRYSVDIESSLIAAGYGSRLDGRLYEGVWSWIQRYDSIINAERFSTLICESHDEWIARFFGALLSNINPAQWKGVINRCRKMCSRSWKNTPLMIDFCDRNWRSEDPLLKEWGIFYDHIKPRDKMQNSDIILRNNALMRYRYLYGTVMRADVLYLLSISHGTQAKREIDFLTSARLADRLCCHLSTIHRIQKDLEEGGFIEQARGHEIKRLMVTWQIKDIGFLRKEEDYDVGMIDWNKINGHLRAVLNHANLFQTSPSEAILKAKIQEFQNDFFPILLDHEVRISREYGSALGPLEKYSVDELFNTLHKTLQSFYRYIFGLP